MNPAKLWTGRKGERPADRFLVLEMQTQEESHTLGKHIWGQHKAQQTCFMAATVSPVPENLPQTPRSKHSSQVWSSHQQEMHSLKSGLPDSFASSKLHSAPRPLPQAPTYHMDRTGFRSVTRACSPAKPLAPGQLLTLASVKTSRSAYLTCLPFEENTA